jgi:hypothetical protein
MDFFPCLEHLNLKQNYLNKLSNPFQILCFPNMKHLNL